MSDSTGTPTPPSPPSTPSGGPAGAERSGAAAGWTVHAEVGADMVGEVLDGRFEVVERIGRGGAGWVFKCADRALHGLAAVKVLRGESAGARRRFADEARLLANVRHLHLVQVLATGTTEDGAPYMAMEYLPGPCLGDRLRAGPLAWQEAVEIGAQVADALAALHRVGVIHRDVKPSNVVMLADAFGRPSVKVIDLGVAKVLDWGQVQGAIGEGGEGGEGAMTRMWRRRATEAGLVVGTPGYAAPEAGLAPADARFDVYGLGVTLYQLCTGTMPEVGARRAMGAVRPEAGIPGELEGLVAEMLAIVPEERVGSMAEVRRRLEAIARGATAGVERLPFYGMFEVLESLGAGAKAEVFRAYDRDPRRYVALKVLREDVRERAEEVRRLGVEARVLAAVRDEALPRLYTARLEGRPFLVMSVAEGRPAIEFCLAGNTLRVDEVVAVGRQIGGALATLHARGILHRDVNAANVIVARGAETRATLIDLGMAELTATFWAQAEDRYLTPPEERVALGTGGLETLEWTAPEARAGKGWSGKSDVFSLGIVLFRLLTGKRPFAERGAEARPVLEVMPGCPAELAAVIGWALEVDPGRRCDARELVAALSDAAEELAAVAGGVAVAREGGEGDGTSSSSRRASSARARGEAGAGSSGLSLSTRRESSGSSMEGAMEAARVERRERWRWRAIYALGIFGFVYLGFLVGLMVRVDQAEDEGAAVRAKTQAAEARTSARVVADDAAGGDSVAAAVGLVGIEAEDASGPSGTVEGGEAEEHSVGQEGQKASEVAGEVEAAVADAKVPTTATGGPLSRAQVRRVLGAKMPALRECVGGLSAVRVKVAIDADGRIRRATIAEDVPTLTRACVEGVLGGVRFPAAGGASTHTIDLGRR